VGTPDKGDNVFMDKKEGLCKINDLIYQVNYAGSFKGRAKLLSTLNGLYDLVNDYKTTTGLYKYIVKEANSLVENSREKLNAGS
jgi:hypothetical protein